MKRTLALTRHRIHKESDLIAYITDCTLATVSHMAMLKSKSKSEYARQKNIAQVCIDKMIEFDVDPSTTRAEEIIRAGISVEEWSRKFEN